MKSPPELGAAFFERPEARSVTVAFAPGDPFSPVQAQIKHKNRYLIVQALPNALTTVVVRIDGREAPLPAAE